MVTSIDGRKPFWMPAFVFVLINLSLSTQLPVPARGVSFSPNDAQYFVLAEIE